VAEQFLPGAPIGPGTQVIASPSQFLFTGSEALRATVYTMFPLQTLVLQGRFRADSDGTVKPFSYVLDVPSTSIAGQMFEVPLPVGTLLNLRVGTTSSAVSLGTCFARVQQIVGSGSAATVIGTLLQGYVSTNVDLGWPGSPLASMHDGRGALLPFLWTITGLLSLQASFSPPAGLRAVVVSGEVVVTTSAVVADRTIELVIQQAGSTQNIAVAGALTVMPASAPRPSCMLASGDPGHPRSTFVET
jgi:hypothetical protein